MAAASAAGSPLAIEDFAEHRSEWVEPLTIRYGGGVAASFPPPTQGMSALAMLGISEAFDMAALPEADYVHVLVEAAKLAFADRDRHLTDPGFMRVSPEELLAPERLKRLAGQISRRRAMSPGDAAAAAGDTIAITTADRAGNAVSLIQSLYFTWGSALVAGDTGVVLQNRGSFFSLDPASANALAPGKLTMHTLAPSMYLEDGRARFVYGTMGGEGQPQTQAALVTRRLHRGLGPQAAVEAPRWLFGRTWGTPSRALNLEGRYPSDLARDLAARGHDVVVGEAWDDLFGHAQCIWLSPDGEGLLGGSDPRADGAALGFSALAGESLVELDADLGQIGAALDGQAGIGPRAEPALQDAHVLEAHLPELLGDLDAGPLVGRGAIRDDGARGVELEPADARLELLGGQAHRARNLERQGLVGFGLRTSRIVGCLPSSCRWITSDGVTR